MHQLVLKTRRVLGVLGCSNCGHYRSSTLASHSPRDHSSLIPASLSCVDQNNSGVYCGRSRLICYSRMLCEFTPPHCLCLLQIPAAFYIGKCVCVNPVVEL